jgi:3-oxoacyl-[acyl-carrier protein] reductase
MNLELANHTALVLGAGGGLGGAIARTLAREGVSVAVADIDVAAVERTAADVRAGGGHALELQWDLAALETVDRHCKRIEAELGAVDILVAVTGGPPPGPIAGQSLDVWRKHFDSMVLSVIAIADRLLPGMRARKWGRIITSTSSGVVAPIPNLGLSNALRSSLVGWSKTMAGEVGRDGVTCNVIIPGRVATGRIAFLDDRRAEREGRSVEDVRAESAASIPLGRYGEPQEYADVVAFLASKRASYVTGCSIRVDGGYIANV